MQGDPDVLKLLNEQLTSELTAINQYFLHSKMQANWGFTELAEHTRKESFEEMQSRGGRSPTAFSSSTGFRITSDCSRCASARTCVSSSRPTWRSSTRCWRGSGQASSCAARRSDATSANLLEKILANEEEHIDYLETQLQLMDKLGEELYAAQCVSRPPTSL